MEPEEINPAIRRIYDETINGNFWPFVLTFLQKQTSSAATAIVIQDAKTQHVKLFRQLGINKEYSAPYKKRFSKFNTWLHPKHEVGQGLLLTDKSIDQTCQKDGGFTKTDFFGAWLEPQGLRHCMISLLPYQENDLLSFLYLRTAVGGPYQSADIDRHELFSRHIRTAIKVNHRLEHYHSLQDAAYGLIEGLPCSVAILNAAGSVAFANKNARNIFKKKDGVQIREQEIFLDNIDENAQLQKTIQNILTKGLPRCPSNVVSMKVSRPSGKPPFFLAVAPVALQQQAFGAYIFINDPLGRPLINESYLELKNNLTVSESRVAGYLAQGYDLKEISKILNISYETTRWYLKQIFQKTGTRKQTELIRYLVTDIAMLIDLKDD